MSAVAQKGEQGFESYYEALYGERWAPLRAQLLSPPHHVSLTHGLVTPYYLDSASYEVVRALPLPGLDGNTHHVDPGATAATHEDAPLPSSSGGPNISILDMCAAPGGKTLVLAVRLGLQGTLIANERSSARRARLHRVLDEHLPYDVRKTIQITGHDARRWGLYEQDRYDAVLLDAPCSSERHVLSSPKHLAAWSSGRIRRLAAEQTAMLQAAVTAVRPGGVVLYVTCALTKAENDGVVAKVLRRRRGEVAAESFSLSCAEPTAHGVQYLPDSADGRGPLYAALLTKKS